MLPLHIGADHLGYLPLLLAVGVIVFIAGTALRTKLERMSDEHKRRDAEGQTRRRESGRSE